MTLVAYGLIKIHFKIILLLTPDRSQHTKRRPSNTYSDLVNKVIPVFQKRKFLQVHGSTATTTKNAANVHKKLLLLLLLLVCFVRALDLCWVKNAGSGRLWGGVVLDNMIVPQLVKYFSAVYGTPEVHYLNYNSLSCILT